MSGKGDPFGSGGKTVIMPNPGGAPKRDPFEPLPPLVAAEAGPAVELFSSPVFNPSPPAVRPWHARGRSERLGLRAHARQGRCPGQLPRRSPARCPRGRAAPRSASVAAHSPRRRAARHRSGRVFGGQPDHPGRRAAAHPARTPAAAYRRHAGRAADDACGARHHRVREEGAGDGRASRRRRRSPNTRCAAPPTTSSRTCPAPTAMSGCSTACWRSSSACARPASASSRS